ncbi:P-loop NTPase family protein [Conexibacter woesei]|uniref:TraD/TraG TraM recognition site domain-containing protein n=1 Tax=Conexibacter woesei (strain DSM 14684 / CCUG 47730 / CIP 108061 / JCM 11494 / NBRC 100937 / ID131577) TaxID=469383 RepID=D3EZ03_CONWI|nr:hypothetical protein [Conexibacter woesei]ADB49877.1 hypothetical protein Cwoe_1449 [Conexibacter woesei DSM 14684]
MPAARRIADALIGLLTVACLLAPPAAAAERPASTRTTTTTTSAAPPARVDPGAIADRAARGAPARIGDAAGAVWGAAGLPLVALALAAGALGAVRWRARRQRSYVRLWLLPFRADQAEPEDVRRLLESWHQQLLERWWRRIVAGQRGMAIELVVAPDAEGDRSARLTLVCPEELVDGIEGSLLACYPDSRLRRGGQALPPVSRVVRLKKRQTFVRALRGAEDDERQAVDAVLSQMGSVAQTSIVQYALTPAPALFDVYSRWRYGRLEHVAADAHVRNPSKAGLRSEVLGRELEGGLRIQHRALFFCDLRVAAEDDAGCAAVAGALRGASSAENRLVERRMRIRRELYLDRLRTAVGNPLPSWRRGVLSSGELAGLCALPSPGLKTVRVVRSPLPRLMAPPDVSRAPEHTLARDERGSVGIRPQDKSDGLGLIGGQKTGKTAVLCRTVEADALDPGCALVVLMPKPGDAQKALSMVPPGRTVHYLDLERPELGINPLMGDGDPAMIADKVVDAFRDVNAEGDIKGSSDRYLRQAAQAAIGASRRGVVEGPPTLWHMYRMLLPPEVSFRERVVEALFADPWFTDTATFFGRELPSDLANAAAQTNAKLDAPRNKLLRLMVESLDKVLRHPIQLSLDDVIARREVLIVDGKMGTFGADNCRVMMQFVLTALYGALQRAQQLPEEQRPRVALKVDEAHLIINDSFADALATLRSAGLEVTAAWQYGEQIQDPKLRGGLMSLLRQRCMFSMGESQDALEMSRIAMAAYTDLIRDDTASRARLRVTPDTIFNLPNHHTVCSWISRGARQPAFIAQTLPLETRADVIEQHRAAQTARGGFVPERLPDPLPDLDWRNGLLELPTADVMPVAAEPAAAVAAEPVAAKPERVAAAPARPTPVAAAPRPVTLPERPRATAGPPSPKLPAARPPARKAERPAPPAPAPEPPAPAPEPVPAPARAAPRAAVPDSFAELDLDDVRGIIWDNPRGRPRAHEPSERELEILGALWSYRFLFATQIWRRWWSGSSLRASQQGLQKMAAAGWVRRFKFQVAERGTQQRVYCLSRAGFELLRGRGGRNGRLFVADDATWREPQIADPRRVLRDLHVNGWVLALESGLGRSMTSWRGPRAGRLEPPRRKHQGQWVDLRPSEVVLGTNHKLQGFEGTRFEPVSPDATLGLRLTGDGPRRVELMVDLDRSRGGGASEERLRRYDGFVSGWWQLLDRYKGFGLAPLVVFVSEDERAALRLLKLADRVVATRVAKAGTPELEWPYPGRRGLFFAVERDLHEGSLEAFALPEHPPHVREQIDGQGARVCRPRRVYLIDPKRLGA